MKLKFASLAVACLMTVAFPFQLWSFYGFLVGEYRPDDFGVQVFSWTVGLLVHVAQTAFFFLVFFHRPSGSSTV